MSNKLVEHKESKEILTGNQKKILFWICFIILSIAFITVWINILLTSKAFNTQMEEMVLGEDYYMEDIVITGKRAEDASADTIWDHLSSVNAKHWTSLLQNMLHFMAKKTGRFLHMKEMSLLSITIFFRSLVIRNSQRSIPDSSKDIIRVF